MTLDEKTLAEVERRLAAFDSRAMPALGDLVTAINALIAALREAWRERDEAIQLAVEGAKLDEQMRDGLAWIESVKEASVCAFCAPANPETQEKAQRHMRTCEEHPLSSALARVAELETALREIADFGKCEPVLYGNDEWFVNIARRAIGEGK